MEQENDSEKLAEQVTTPPMQLVFEALGSYGW